NDEIIGIRLDLEFCFLQICNLQIQLYCALPRSSCCNLDCYLRGIDCRYFPTIPCEKNSISTSAAGNIEGSTCSKHLCNSHYQGCRSVRYMLAIQVSFIPILHYQTPYLCKQ